MSKHKGNQFILEEGVIHLGKRDMFCDRAFYVPSKIMKLLNDEYETRLVPWTSFKFADQAEEDRFFNDLENAVILSLELEAYKDFVDDALETIKEKGLGPFNICLKLNRKQLNNVLEKGSLESDELILPEFYLYHQHKVLSIYAERLDLDLPAKLRSRLFYHTMSFDFNEAFSRYLSKHFIDAFKKLPRKCVKLIASNSSKTEFVQIVNPLDVIGPLQQQTAIINMKLGERKIPILINISGKLLRRRQYYDFTEANINKLKTIIPSIKENRLRRAFEETLSMIERRNTKKDRIIGMPYRSMLHHVDPKVIQEYGFANAELGRGDNILWYSCTDRNDHYSDVDSWSFGSQQYTAFIMVAETNNMLHYYVFENDMDKSVYVFCSKIEDRELSLFSLWAYWGSDINNKRQEFPCYSSHLPFVDFLYKMNYFKFKNPDWFFPWLLN